MYFSGVAQPLPPPTHTHIEPRGAIESGLVCGCGGSMGGGVTKGGLQMGGVWAIDQGLVWGPRGSAGVTETRALNGRGFPMGVKGDKKLNFFAVVDVSMFQTQSR